MSSVRGDMALSIAGVALLFSIAGYFASCAALFASGISVSEEG